MAYNTSDKHTKMKPNLKIVQEDGLYMLLRMFPNVCVLWTSKSQYATTVECKDSNPVVNSSFYVPSSEKFVVKFNIWLRLAFSSLDLFHKRSWWHHCTEESDCSYPVGDLQHTTPFNRTDVVPGRLWLTSHHPFIKPFFKTLLGKVWDFRSTHGKTNNCIIWLQQISTICILFNHKHFPQ